MSKKYFTKLLPSEGTIDVGDLFIRESGVLTKWSLKEQDKYNAAAAKWPHPLKLFLCSREIKVGEKAYYSGELHNNTIVWTIDSIVNEVAKSGSSGLDARYLYTIVGKISPNAIWVKEGNEFDETDIYRGFLHYHPKYGYSEEHFWEKGGVKVPVIKIKCPCCGDFK